MKYETIREKVTDLRKKGYTYSEINRFLGVTVPKSTLSSWFKNLNKLEPGQEKKLRSNNLKHLSRIRILAQHSKQQKKQEFLREIQTKNQAIKKVLDNPYAAKAILAILYLAEGKKSNLALGNSDPYIIRLFLHLLRSCFKIDESRLRCTVQCRADQDTESLQNFWSEITQIPLTRFYKPIVDPRTIGKPSKKANYKGVCKIDYSSVKLLIEIQEIAKLVFAGP